MKKLLLIVFCMTFYGCSQNLSKFDYLKNPQIRTMPKQKMLVIELTGDPNTTAKTAFKTLFKAIFRLKKTNNEVKLHPPRARWPKPLDSPREEWIGYYGFPIPDSINKMIQVPEGLKIEDWEYGEVAEVLHVGPYSEESPTIDKLVSFIGQKGYKISGMHEEEYIKGPGMIFKGNPKNYLTMIRYQIEKR